MERLPCFSVPAPDESALARPCLIQNTIAKFCERVATILGHGMSQSPVRAYFLNRSGKISQIVHLADFLLKSFHDSIELASKAGRKTSGEYFHGIAQSFCG